MRFYLSCRFEGKVAFGQLKIYHGRYACKSASDSQSEANSLNHFSQRKVPLKSQYRFYIIYFVVIDFVSAMHRF
jgi:hypothetical protein